MKLRRGGDRRVSVVARIEDKCADPASELESIGGEHGNSGEVSGILVSIINSQKDDVKMIGKPNVDNNKK